MVGENLLESPNGHRGHREQDSHRVANKHSHRHDRPCDKYRAATIAPEIESRLSSTGGHHEARIASLQNLFCFFGGGGLCYSHTQRSSIGSIADPLVELRGD